MQNMINGQTKVVGILGCPVEHTFSPAMHNAAFRQLGLNFVYVPFQVQPATAAMAVQGIRALSLAGVNVTIPYKSAVIEYLDYTAPEALLIGAVNTIVNDNGTLKGHNTDAPGFLKSLETEAGFRPQDKKILILGAGGAARAVSVQLALVGAREIVIAAPTAVKIKRIREAVSRAASTIVHAAAWDEAKIAGFLEDTDILINATPVGMYPHIEEMPPVNIKALPKHALICDLIYNPTETMLMRRAKEQGIKAMNGLSMLLYQGALAFEKWTGFSPPLDVMSEALVSFMKQR